MRVFALDQAGHAAIDTIHTAMADVGIRLEDHAAAFTLRHGGGVPAGLTAHALVRSLVAGTSKAVVDGQGRVLFPGIRARDVVALILQGPDKTLQPLSVRVFDSVDRLGLLKQSETGPGLRVDFPDGVRTSYKVIRGWDGSDAKEVARIRIVLRPIDGRGTVLATAKRVSSGFALPAWIDQPGIALEAELEHQWVGVSLDAQRQTLIVRDLIVVKGSVVADTGGEPLPHARIMAYPVTSLGGVGRGSGPAVTCDSQGRFLLLLPEQARLVVQIVADGFTSRCIELSEFEEAIDVRLRPARAVRVIGTPSEHFRWARIQVRSVGNRVRTSYAAVLNEQGTGSLELDEGVEYRISAGGSTGCICAGTIGAQDRELVLSAPPWESRRIQLGTELADSATRGCINWYGDWDVRFRTRMDVFQDSIRIAVPLEAVDGTLALFDGTQVIARWQGTSRDLPGELSVRQAEPEFVEILSYEGKHTITVLSADRTTSSVTFIRPGQPVRLSLPRSQEGWWVGPAKGVPALFPPQVGRIVLDDLLVALTVEISDDLAARVRDKWTFRAGGLTLTSEAKVVSGMKNGMLRGIISWQDGTTPKEESARLRYEETHWSLGLIRSDDN